MKLYLIRHGESYVNLPDWQKGYIDVGLTELGHQQAHALAKWLPSHIPTIDMLYTSTMKRAQETASYIAKTYDQPIHEDDRLREAGNNRSDHTPWASEDLPHEVADFWASERPFSLFILQEHSETWMHFRTRVGLFIEDMVENYRDKIVVAVCHGGVVTAAFDHVFNVGAWQQCDIRNHNTGITHFEYVNLPNREKWWLHYHNRVEHL